MYIDKSNATFVSKKYLRGAVFSSAGVRIDILIMHCLAECELHNITDMFFYFFPRHTKWNILHSVSQTHCFRLQVKLKTLKKANCVEETKCTIHT